MVTPSVTIHSIWETCIYGASGRQKRPRSLPPLRRGPRHRSSDDGRRDDDTAAKEYSPRRPVCQKPVGDAQPGAAEGLCDDAPMTAVQHISPPAGEDRYLPTKYAQSHWGPDHLNGPALVGLAARALEDKFGLARVHAHPADGRPVQGGPRCADDHNVTLVRDGRRVRNSECEIVQDGVTVVRATMVRLPPVGGAAR